MPEAASKLDCDHLLETAAAQSGYFATQQAAHAGYSTLLLLKHTNAGRVDRARCGLDRLVHFPPAEHEELVLYGLWSEQAGVFSHQTALSLNGLSVALPSQLHLTLPSEWKARRFCVPADVVLHHAGTLRDERAWFGPVLATNSRWSLKDCASEGVSPELLHDPAQQAIRRGLVAKADITEVEIGRCESIQSKRTLLRNSTRTPCPGSAQLTGEGSARACAASNCANYRRESPARCA